MGSSISRGSNSSRASERTREADKTTKRRQLCDIAQATIAQAKLAPSLGNKSNIGLIKSAIERCRASTNLFSTMLGMGVELRNFLFVGKNGTYKP